MSKETLEQRIERERQELNLRPWQYSPSQADGKNPFPPGSVGHYSWNVALEMRAAIKKRDPRYFA